MDYSQIEQKMDKALNFLDEELTAIRAGRANPGILNKVEVEYYGVPTPLNQVAAISVPEPRQILITPWDRSVLISVEKAIQKAEIGINPINDGNAIRLAFPELNEQRRKELVREVSSKGEDAKIAIRNVRRDAMEHAKSEQKSGQMSEDELRHVEDKIQKITDENVQKVDAMVKHKEKEIMEV